MPQIPAHRSNPDPGLLLSVTTVQDPRPGRVVVEVVGEVDAYTAPALDVCLQSQAIQPGVRELVVHLGQVTFIDAAGVEVLAQADRRCRMRGARLLIRSGGRREPRPLQSAGLPTSSPSTMAAPIGPRRAARGGDRGGRRLRAARRHGVPGRSTAEARARWPTGSARAGSSAASDVSRTSASAGRGPRRSGEAGWWCRCSAHASWSARKPLRATRTAR